MKPHQFRPTSLDILEDRLVLSTVVHPVVHVESSVVNPKFLNLTGRTEHQIVNGITSAFSKFTATYHAGTTTAAVQASAFAKLDSDLLAVSHKIPHGGVSFYPTLASLTTGTGGNSPATNDPVLSLGESLVSVTPLTAAQASFQISLYETIIRQTIDNYVHQGATAGEIHLVRGASLPRLTGAGVVGLD